MKFVTYVLNNEEKIGVFEAGKIFEILNYNSLLEIIKDQGKLKISENGIELDEVKLLSPIPMPIRNILCLGKNYKDHVKEMQNKISGAAVLSSIPIYFSKMGYEIVGDKMDVQSYINHFKTMDYEVELAVIIGKKGKNIGINEAKDYVYGYSIGNDLCMREVQENHCQWMKGKSLDTHMALGPVIITRDEIMYPPNLKIETYVNDELRQSSTTDNLIFDIDFIISDLSKDMTLLPGDIILTGTPAGVGMGFNPPKYLKPGDVVKCKIEKIGELVNYIK